MDGNAVDYFSVADSEATIRLVAFAGIFVAMAIAEVLAPRRVPKPEKLARWLTNWAIVVIDSVVLRLVFPAAAVGTAIWAEQNSYGLFHNMPAPIWIAGLVSFVILDFAVWLEHVVSHKLPILWRIHRVHHADIDFDVTTAIRFHPFEIILSMVWKAAIVVTLGAPVVAVLLFEIVLNGCAMFNHSNLKLPRWLDQALRLVIVTPDMHRIHHSVDMRETDSNYGFNFSFWDRLFGTFTANPRLGHGGMIIGLEEHQNAEPTGIAWSLLFPFKPNETRAFNKGQVENTADKSP